MSDFLASLVRQGRAERIGIRPNLPARFASTAGATEESPIFEEREERLAEAPRLIPPPEPREYHSPEPPHRRPAGDRLEPEWYPEPAPARPMRSGPQPQPTQAIDRGDEIHPAPPDRRRAVVARPEVQAPPPEIGPVDAPSPPPRQARRLGPFAEGPPRPFPEIEGAEEVEPAPAVRPLATSPRTVPLRANDREPQPEAVPAAQSVPARRVAPRSEATEGELGPPEVARPEPRVILREHLSRPIEAADEGRKGDPDRSDRPTTPARGASPEISAQPPRPSKPPAVVPAEIRADEGTTVHVSIGRIEVRAISPPASQSRARAASPARSLDDYLSERGRGAGR